MSDPVERPFMFASPAWHPTWRDHLAHWLANCILRLIASREYQVLLRDAYDRAFRCAIEHGADDAPRSRGFADNIINWGPSEDAS